MRAFRVHVQLCWHASICQSHGVRDGLIAENIKLGDFDAGVRQVAKVLGSGRSGIGPGADYKYGGGRLASLDADFEHGAKQFDMCRYRASVAYSWSAHIATSAPTNGATSGPCRGTRTTTAPTNIAHQWSGYQQTTRLDISHPRWWLGTDL